MARSAKGERVDVGEPCVAEHIVIGHEEERDDVADACMDLGDTSLLLLPLLGAFMPAVATKE